MHTHYYILHIMVVNTSTSHKKALNIIIYHLETLLLKNIDSYSYSYASLLWSDCFLITTRSLYFHLVFHLSYFYVPIDNSPGLNYQTAVEIAMNEHRCVSKKLL